MPRAARLELLDRLFETLTWTDISIYIYKGRGAHGGLVYRRAVLCLCMVMKATTSTLCSKLNTRLKGAPVSTVNLALNSAMFFTGILPWTAMCLKSEGTPLEQLGRLLSQREVVLFWPGWRTFYTLANVSVRRAAVVHG